MDLVINKEDVYNEVAKTTNYVASKMDDPTAYERISTTDENREILDRFWMESKNMVSNSLKKVFAAENESDSLYILILNVSEAFDEKQVDSMQRSLFSFFVMNITAKWFNITNKSEAMGYAAEAATYIEEIMRKAYFKKRPTRPTYN